MRDLPLFYPYPLSGHSKPKHPFDIINSDDRKIETINTPLEMLEHSLIYYTGSVLISEFNQRFIKFRQSMRHAGLVPYLKKIPAATRYQRSGFRNNSALLADIAQHGVRLATGQTIFHGGDFQINDIPNLATNPLSTTFSPQIAIWHAYNDGIGKWNYQLSNAPSNPCNPAILVLTVSQRFSKSALIFRKGGPSMADEMEALLEDGFLIVPQSSYIYQGYRDVEIVQATLTD